ncbi:MAG TPA: hypothetical protein VIJ85_12280 [Rhizomicrobium sp.]
MKYVLAIGLIALAIGGPAHAADDPLKILGWSRWTDIGPGRSVAQLKPADITKLRRCADWSMYFERKDGGIDQVFVVGMSMRTHYPKVLVSTLLGETIFSLFPAAASVRPTDTLHLSQNDIALTQISPPFRPHVYLRCGEPTPKKPAPAVSGSK